MLDFKCLGYYKIYCLENYLSFATTTITIIIIGFISIKYNFSNFITPELHLLGLIIIIRVGIIVIVGIDMIGDYINFMVDMTIGSNNNCFLKSYIDKQLDLVNLGYIFVHIINYFNIINYYCINYNLNYFYYLDYNNNYCYYYIYYLKVRNITFM